MRDPLLSIGFVSGIRWGEGRSRRGKFSQRQVSGSVAPIDAWSCRTQAIQEGKSRGRKGTTVARRIMRATGDETGELRHSVRIGLARARSGGGGARRVRSGDDVVVPVLPVSRAHGLAV